MKKRVIFRAPVLTLSGYGIHSRQIFTWLKSRQDIDLTTQVLSWGNTPWLVNPELEDGLIKDIMGTSKTIEGPYDISIQAQLPDEWDTKLGKINIGVTALVETDRCNPKWIDSINKMDLVIVPSEHTKKTIENTASTKTRVIVIPEWYNQKINMEKSDLPDLNLDLNTSFNFLTISQFTGGDPNGDRKNIINTIKYFCEAFEGNRDVGLVIKANMGRATKIDKKLTTNILNNAIKEFRKGEYPRIHLVHGGMTNYEIASLYKMDSIKGYITLTRGEGYGLPIIDAAAAGIPVIATNWSGHLDFMNRGNFIKIDYEMKDIPKSRVDNRIFLEGFRWADPIESDFKIKIKKFRNKYILPQQWAKDLSSSIRDNYSQENIMLLYNNALETLVREQ